MRKILIAAIAVVCLSSGAAMLRAQDESGPIPKVLLIDREMVKFGKDAGHAKNEAAFARAAAEAKSPDHYLAATSVTGPSEAWFLVGFDSYADFEKATAYDDQPKVRALTGPLFEKDADYVSDATETLATYNEKWSYKPDSNIPEMRYFEIETICLRPGHDKDWEDLVAMFQTAAAKANIDEHDIFFEAHYGAENGTIYIFTPRKALGDLDAAMGTGKAFEDALGPDGQKKWAELIRATVASDSTTLIRFSPEMSYPLESWVKADPDFWAPKHMMAPKAAEAPKKKE
ncbi:MAG: hypothetical protein WBC67_18175 [Candidatus Acidiferrales bacterium]